MLRRGESTRAVAAEVGRSLAWVYKWHARFAREGWAGLQSRSRVPDHPARRIPDTTRQAICQARSALEAEAAQPDALCYGGDRAILGRLRQQRVTPLPSLNTIEREVRAALAVGTELVFSPVRHPRSQGAVERFHRDYQRHVGAKADLADLAAVQRDSMDFPDRPAPARITPFWEARPPPSGTWRAASAGCPPTSRGRGACR